MRFDWTDYYSSYTETVDSWLDEDAKRFTGCDEGFDEYYQYWKNDPQTKLGENFWVKIISADAFPVGVIAVASWNEIFTISEFIISTEKRGKGIGSSALKEFLDESKDIIGLNIKDANAVIFSNNVASQKAFEKAGFVFHHEHPDGDAWYYRYHKAV